MNVLIVSPEVYPFAKTGGLADVAGTLPPALKELDLDVRVIMPRHGSIDPDQEVICDFPVHMGRFKATAMLKVNAIGEVPVYLVDNYRYFGRKDLYGHEDDAERYTFFSKAVLEAMKRIDFQPDIIHCNDWQSGLIPALLEHQYGDDPFYAKTKTLYTIHNLAYNGSFPHEVISMTGLPQSVYTPEEIEFYGAFCYSKAGIVYADAVSTVSPTYAKEVQTEEFGYRLDGILRVRSKRMFGILNGIDNDVWNPKTDELLPANFTKSKMKGKAECKAELQDEVGLEQEPNTPLIGMVTRLSAQKGLDILVPAMEHFMSEKMQFVLLGSGDKHYEFQMGQADKRFHNAACLIKYDEGMAHRIYASCDFFLIPSLYEPCGLTQMISFRYGTLPIVRRTGGLADTVIDLDKHPKSGNGFVFDDYNPDQLADAIVRAVKFYSKKTQMKKAVSSAMDLDYTWTASAKEYEALYGKMTRFRKRV